MPPIVVGLVIVVVIISAYGNSTATTPSISFQVYWPTPSTYVQGTVPPSAYLQINETGPSRDSFYYVITYNSTAGEVIATQGAAMVAQSSPLRAYVYVPISPVGVIIARATVYGSGSIQGPVLYSQEITL
ncbi:MAG: hypothetical protein JRM74_04640 [Nitrososphaerota archaeon]|nr:hypothetical protein [Nitrososphaerota archaeon]